MNNTDETSPNIPFEPPEDAEVINWFGSGSKIYRIPGGEDSEVDQIIIQLSGEQSAIPISIGYRNQYNLKRTMNITGEISSDPILIKKGSPVITNPEPWWLETD